MINITKITLFYYTIRLFGIVSLSSIDELPISDVIVNINKGFALRRLGEYSPNVVEQIAHSFISLGNLCITSPNTDVCLHNTNVKGMSIFELATVMASRDVFRTVFSYNKEKISKLISNDIIQILSQHQPGEIINNTKMMIHFINDRFHYSLSDEKANKSVDDTNIIDNYYHVPRFRSTAADTIVQQISSHRVDFEYLSFVDLKIFLSAIFSTFDNSYGSESVEDRLNVFDQLVVGQTVHGLRYCSLDRENPSVYNPCLVISTLFLRTPPAGISKFSVFQLFPLPIVHNHNQYVYSNIPKILGINFVDQTLVMWDNDAPIDQCTFSPIVFCRFKPVSVSLSKVSCLLQLLDNHILHTNLCEVKRSNNIQQDVVHISDGLWLFSNVNHITYCQLYSTANALPETIKIEKASVVSVSCNKTMICPDFQLPVEVCRRNRASIVSSTNFTPQNVSRFILPIINMTQRILSSYGTQNDNSVKDLMNAFKARKSILDLSIEDLAACIISFVCFILMIIWGYIMKRTKYNSKKKMINFQSQLHDIINI